MNTTDALKLAWSLMEEHGLAARGWRITFDNARVRFGACKHRQCVLSFSRPLTLLNGEAEFRDVVLHEIAHALNGITPRGQGHGARWKAIARRIGAQPERCYDSEKVVAPEPRYIGMCPAGHKHSRSRLPSRAQSCGRCSRSYDAAYSIKWEKNPQYKP